MGRHKGSKNRIQGLDGLLLHIRKLLNDMLRGHLSIQDIVKLKRYVQTLLSRKVTIKMVRQTFSEDELDTLLKTLGILEEVTKDINTPYGCRQGEEISH